LLKKTLVSNHLFKFNKENVSNSNRKSTRDGKKLETNEMNKPLTFLLSLIFLFLFSGSVYGQEEVKKEYWENGKLRKEVHYKNGKKDGLETWWYESGKKKREIHYKNGKEEGLETLWWESGEKNRETLRTPQGFYFDGINEKSDKLIRTWWKNGKLYTEFYFRGKSPTLWTWWYESGIKQSEELWEDGKRVIITNFNESGKKVIEYKYKNGEPFSQSNFYPTGIKKSRKYFKGGLENGIRTEWSEDGKKTYEGNFVDGNEE
jgi:antitoxin component YwqK of YwqJK toxin-antitoxin module